MNELRTDYVPLAEVVRWDRNPKLHDAEAIAASIRRHGFRDAPILDRTLGALVAGNGRVTVLALMEEQGEPAPAGIRVADDGTWLVPVQTGVDAATTAEAEAFAIDHNNLTWTGGNLTLRDGVKLWDASFAGLVADLAGQGAQPVSLDDDDVDALTRWAKDFGPGPDSTSDGESAGNLAGFGFRVATPAAYADVVGELLAKLIAEHPEWGAVVGDA